MTSVKRIVATITTPEPQKAAESFRLQLALDRGYTSEIQPFTFRDDAVLLVASDGKAVLFRSPDGHA